MKTALHARRGRLTRARDSFRRHPRITAVTAAAVTAIGATGFVRHARLTLPYLLIVLTFAAVVAVADDRVRFSKVTLVGLAVWATLHLAGGLIELDDGRIVYNLMFTRWIHLDNVVHLIGFGSAGLAIFEALSVSVAVPVKRTTAWAVAWIGAMGAGAFNEVIEFAATHLLGATNVGGYQNTGRDLVANMIGGAIAGVLAAKWVGRPRNGRELEDIRDGGHEPRQQ